MFQFSATNFRGFRDLQFVDVKPITLLIGENSAGKSSFLAGLKYIIDFISGTGSPSFNKDPFQLGTFQQISHYRGGKAGRAREFSLHIKSTVDRDLRSKSETDLADVVFDIGFASAESQASISHVNIAVGNEGLRARFDNDKLVLEYISESNDIFAVTDLSSFPRMGRAEFNRYWPFLLQDLRFRVSRLSTDGEEKYFPPDIENRMTRLAEFADSLAQRMSGHLEATSAIRTKPLRTYTPGVETRDGEGSHVPFEIAKLYRGRNKDPWRRLKNAIEAYGRTSEMFKEIGIKAFGQAVSDPFQIQFASDGPKTNLVDLGYGTSQILPILFTVSTGSPGSRYLIQQPEVHLHPKAQAALGSYFVEEFVGRNKQFILETHSDYIVDRVRRAVATGVVRASDVSILFFERKRLENTVTQIVVDDLGAPIDPPDSYREFFIDEQLRLLGVD